MTVSLFQMQMEIVAQVVMIVQVVLMQRVGVGEEVAMAQPVGLAVAPVPMENHADQQPLEMVVPVDVMHQEGVEFAIQKKIVANQSPLVVQGVMGQVSLHPQVAAAVIAIKYVAPVKLVATQVTLQPLH